MMKLLEEHLDYNVEQYNSKSVSKKGWETSLAMALSKRCYLYRKIVDKARNIVAVDKAAQLQEAARQLDAERGTMSVNKYMEQEKAKDRQIGKIQKRKVNNQNGPKKRNRKMNNI